MLSNLLEHILDDEELIGDKGEGRRELLPVGESLDVQHLIIKGIEIFEDGMFLIIDCVKEMIGLLRFGKHTLFDHLIHRRGGKAQTCVEPALDLGKVIPGDVNHGVNGFLTRDHDPNLSHTAGTDLFY